MLSWARRGAAFLRRRFRGFLRGAVVATGDGQGERGEQGEPPHARPTAAERASERPSRSRARTATHGTSSGNGIVASNPVFGTASSPRSFFLSDPPSSCHERTSVAPFQLTNIVSPSTAADGLLRGRPTHAKRYARYESTPERPKRRSSSGLPCGPNSVT